MKTPIQIARDTAQELMADSRYVFIDKENVTKLAKTIKSEVKELDVLGAPNIKLSHNNFIANIQIICFELMASAINYKYWYGRPDIRVNGSSSTEMYKLLEKTFSETFEIVDFSISYQYTLINRFIANLSEARFPMLTQRIDHLQELTYDHRLETVSMYFANQIEDYEEGVFNWNIENDMDILLKAFPGFSNDIFLKRANLFFMMLYRRKGWYKKVLNQLIIPADYHIPKMFRYYGCIRYNDELSKDIETYNLIPEGSLKECEIRSAAIVVAEMMAEDGLNALEVDDYLWRNRKICNDPFHLTVTTNY